MLGLLLWRGGALIIILNWKKIAFVDQATLYSSRSSPYSYSHLSFKKKMKTKTSKRPIRQKIPKHSKRKQNKIKRCHKNILGCQLLLGMEPGPKCDCYSRWEHWRKPAFLLPAGIHFRHSLSWGGARVHLLTGLGWSGLNLCRSCAYCHRPCEFIHASDLLCLEDIVHSSHLSPLAPCSYSSENDEPRGGTVQTVLDPPMSIINPE